MNRPLAFWGAPLLIPALVLAAVALAVTVGYNLGRGGPEPALVIHEVVTATPTVTFPPTAFRSPTPTPVPPEPTPGPPTSTPAPRVAQQVASAPTATPDTAACFNQELAFRALAAKMATEQYTEQRLTQDAAVKEFATAAAGGPRTSRVPTSVLPTYDQLYDKALAKLKEGFPPCP
jgi:hypothetical protein